MILNGRVPVVAPKLVMTDLWRQSRIDPAYWQDLMLAQEWANYCFIDEGSAYPEDCLDKDLFFLAGDMPPTYAAAMLRRRLLRGVALRKAAQRRGWPVA